MLDFISVLTPYMPRCKKISLHANNAFAANLLFDVLMQLNAGSVPAIHVVADDDNILHLPRVLTATTATVPPSLELTATEIGNALSGVLSLQELVLQRVTIQYDIGPRVVLSSLTALDISASTCEEVLILKVINMPELLQLVLRLDESPIFDLAAESLNQKVQMLALEMESPGLGQMRTFFRTLPRLRRLSYEALDLPVLALRRTGVCARLFAGPFAPTEFEYDRLLAIGDENLVTFINHCGIYYHSERPLPLTQFVVDALTYASDMVDAMIDSLERLNALDASMGEIADRPAMDAILNSVGAFIERISEHYRNPHWEVPRARQHEFLLPPGFRVPRESARQLPDFELWDNKGIRDAPLEAWLQIASSAPPALTSEPSPQRVRPPGRRARATSSIGRVLPLAAHLSLPGLRGVSSLSPPSESVQTKRSSLLLPKVSQATKQRTKWKCCRIYPTNARKPESTATKGKGQEVPSCEAAGESTSAESPEGEEGPHVPERFVPHQFNTQIAREALSILPDNFLATSAKGGFLRLGACGNCMIRNRKCRHKTIWGPCKACERKGFTNCSDKFTVAQVLDIVNTFEPVEGFANESVW
ncbi:hypothetical protein R3P38DRAFT_3173708 [Favolaschia claudopus]|uniref:Zn(2)-C6 fungal-type domain-containing protein n=1 Tax=Favolaschia claudopus TaxID=2862362 RepID=A0AAW0DFY4_9AGAR